MTDFFRVTLGQHDCSEIGVSVAFRSEAKKVYLPRYELFRPDTQY